MMSREITRALYDGDLEKFDVLVQQGVHADLNTDYDKWNLLHMALVSVSLPPVPMMITHLIQFGVAVNAKDRYGNTPLHYAARLKNPEIIKMLLDAGAEVDPVNQDGLTPLHLMLTTKPHNLEAIEMLLTHGADVQQRTKGGITLRDYAEAISQSDSPEILKLFDKYTNVRGNKR